MSGFEGSMKIKTRRVIDMWKMEILLLKNSHRNLLALRSMQKQYIGKHLISKGEPLTNFKVTAGRAGPSREFIQG